MNKAELQKSAVGYSVATVGNLASFEGKANSLEQYTMTDGVVEE